MTSADEGSPLTGGNSNAPVRYGDRVHRTSGPWSPTVHAYLRHLRRHGVDLVPEPFGFDEHGREVLEFLPGEVPDSPWPDDVWADAFLCDAGRVLRRLHDASLGFDPAGGVWQQPTRPPAEVVSVNDFAPYNLVVRDGCITGVIDLDQASPGPRVRDLGHLAYRLAPLTAPENLDGRPLGTIERGRRLRLLAEAYGALGPGALGPGALGAGALGPVALGPVATGPGEVGAGLPGPGAVLRAVGPLLADFAAHAEAAGRPDHALLYRTDAAWLTGSADAVLNAAG